MIIKVCFYRLAPKWPPERKITAITVQGNGAIIIYSVDTGGTQDIKGRSLIVQWLFLLALSAQLTSLLVFCLSPILTTLFQ